ncbi:hypothetical protein [Oceaniglobus trochenteri]|uniref:hypothetical protein n=1 Tax=Oceaniglobus trochenteri TaxID=2763260 RepID=UPI001CFFE10B|nr:hypothetical protein [Oceaniglobus trochenteri]
MSRPLIATILSAALALSTLGAAPAQADNDNLKRLLGGVATVIILGATYDHFRDKRQREAEAERPDYRPRPEVKIVPSECLRRTETRHGTERYFAKRCLQRKMRHANRLPAACEIRVGGGHKNRRDNGYSPRCLHSYGWRRG